MFPGWSLWTADHNAKSPGNQKPATGHCPTDSGPDGPRGSRITGSAATDFALEHRNDLWFPDGGIPHPRASQ